MRKLLTIAILVTFFTACSSDDQKANGFAPQKLAFKIVASGTHEANPWQEQTVVINSKEALEELLGDKPDEGNLLSNFDFDNSQLIALSGAFATAIRLYSIDEVREFENHITVQYTFYHSEGVATNAYQPWLFAKMPKSNKPLIFVKKEAVMKHIKRKEGVAPFF